MKIDRPPSFWECFKFSTLIVLASIVALFILAAPLLLAVAFRIWWVGLFELPLVILIGALMMYCKD